jgi:hypothetical protein
LLVYTYSMSRTERVKESILKDFRHLWFPVGYVFALLSLTIFLNTPTALAAPVQSGISPSLTTHIMGYWKFDEGSGSTALDSSGHNGNGTITGAEYSTNHAPVTGSTYSLSFNGNGDLVSIPNSKWLNFSATNPLTISLWFNLSASPPVWHAIGKRVGCDLTSLNYQLAYDPTHGLLFDSGGNIVPTGILSVPTGVWMHFAATYNPKMDWLKVYLNGKRVAYQTGYTLAGENTAPLLIAESGTCGYTFPGNLDEVCILKQTLDAAQIDQLYAGLPCNELS